ncbi:hypothetical protein KPL78_21860 [Roseomonas sp. HJA6]|uniref:Uncharacterized protein n=1 Tax=Roseomonas alba TaxID=2846776 RepID=A0ABS7AGR0_9PROT|nr:hypothetical protein [Neoroseomonas alba]MBW6400520.1 hypothetical protein [Neoroseomonas alba]
MRKQLARQDFVIKDLAVSIGGGSRGGTWLPGPDDETPPSPISPIASVLVNIGIIETVRATILDALQSRKDFDAIGRAFIRGEPGGDPGIRAAIHEIGAAVVASAAYAAMGGGAVGMPNPDCGGTSLETIPTPITPVVHVGREVHRVSELPRLRKQLALVVQYVDGAAKAQAPMGAEVAMVRAELEGALKSLGT